MLIKFCATVEVSEARGNQAITLCLTESNLIAIGLIS